MLSTSHYNAALGRPAKAAAARGRGFVFCEGEQKKRLVGLWIVQSKKLASLLQTRERSLHDFCLVTVPVIVAIFFANFFKLNISKMKDSSSHSEHSFLLI